MQLKPIRQMETKVEACMRHFRLKNNCFLSSEHPQQMELFGFSLSVTFSQLLGTFLQILALFEILETFLQRLRTFLKNLGTFLQPLGTFLHNTLELF